MLSLQGKIWNLPTLSREKGESLGAYLRRSRAFIFSEEEAFHDPFLFDSMEKACERVFHAIDAGERIVVYGDYDVDGTSGTALLVHGLESLGATVSYRIPHRVKDGYGLHSSFVQELLEAGVSLLITVDCGISCPEPVALAQAGGMDVIITDHHAVPPVLPEAYAILHPLVGAYPNPFLSGSGVAWKFLSALLILAGRDEEIDFFMDLASLGTVADCVALRGENRLLVKKGLEQMEKTKWTGLAAMCQSLGAMPPYKAEMIGFQIGPRINASGRMDHAYWAVQTLLEKNQEKALQKAQKLEEFNRFRQEENKRILEETADQIRLDEPVIIVRGPWNSGLVGLAAGRLCERYGKASFVLGEHEGRLTGSARSLPGFHLVEHLREIEDLLLGYGGHENAAGFHLKVEDYERFCERLQAVAKASLHEKEILPSLALDAELQADDLDLFALSDLACLEPFGMKNPEPLFYVKAKVNGEPRFVGKDGDHVQCKLWLHGQELPMIAFFAKELAPQICEAQEFIVRLQKNVWQGRESLQLQFVDAR